jgi:ABC-2 type transport system permease protein
VFGALTIVRERELGVVEIYRVAPLGAVEAILGKYLSYLLLGGAVAAGLTAMVVYGLGVPMAGSWADLVVALALTLFASIGLGLIISTTSRTDSQAVQYSMILLLASLFFSGLFLSVSQLARPAQVVSWALPATYGMRLLRDVMLRGAGLDPAIAAGLAAYGLAALAASIFGAHRSLAPSR